MPDGILNEDEEDDEDTTTLRSASVSPSTEFSLSQLLNEAERQTEKESTTLKSRWTPGATIEAYDDVAFAYKPLCHVKVRICVLGFIKTHKYTDVNGNVEFSPRRRKASYSIEWESYYWDIRDGNTQAYYNGPRQHSHWNLQIGKGTKKSLHYSAIHRALYEYYYGDNCGFTRPNKSVKISYEEGIDSKRKAQGRTITETQKVYIWGTIRPNDNVTGYTIRQLNEKIVSFISITDVQNYIMRTDIKPFEVNSIDILTLINFYRKLWNE